MHGEKWRVEICVHGTVCMHRERSIERDGEGGWMLNVIVHVTVCMHVHLYFWVLTSTPAYSVGVVLALKSRFPRADICENTQSGLLLPRTHWRVRFCFLYCNLLLMLFGECCSVNNDQGNHCFCCILCSWIEKCASKLNMCCYHLWLVLFLSERWQGICERRKERICINIPGENCLNVG